jgi:hypothetical protein
MSIHISTYMPTSTSTYTWASYNATTIVSSSDMSSSLLSILAFLTWTVLGVRALWQRCRVIFHTPSHPEYITSFFKYLEQLHECSVCEWFLQALLSENSYCGQLRKSSTKVIIHLDLHFYSCTYIILGHKAFSSVSCIWTGHSLLLLHHTQSFKNIH